MARSHAKIQVRVWRDPEWVNLSPPAKLLYVLLLTQPKLTLVGSLDVSESRWSSLSGLSRDDVTLALMELEHERYVLVDRATDELLIRSFTKNDLDPNRCNMNLAKGLWGQWAAIESADLRAAALRYMPDAIWDRIVEYAPVDAEQIRRSAQLEPVVETRRSDQAFEPPPSSRLPTETGHRPDGDVPDAPSVDNCTPLRNRLTLLIEDPPEFGHPRSQSLPKEAG